MILWSFEGTDTRFRSTPAKHERDIFKMAKACGVSPETKIIYHDGKPNHPSIADTFAVDSNTTTDEQQDVQSTAGTRKPRRKKAAQLPDLHGDVDSATSASDSVEQPSDLDDPRSGLQPYWFSGDSMDDQSN